MSYSMLFFRVLRRYDVDQFDRGWALLYMCSQFIFIYREVIVKTILATLLSVMFVISLISCNEPTDNRVAQQSASVTTDTSVTDTFTRDPKGPQFAGITYEKSSPALQTCDLKFSITPELPKEFYVNTDTKSVFTQDEMLAQCVSGVDSTGIQELGRMYFSKSAPQNIGAPPHAAFSFAEAVAVNTDGQAKRPTRPSVDDYLHVAWSFKNVQVARDFVSCVAKGWEEYYKQLSGHYKDAVSKYDLTPDDGNRVHAHYSFTAHTMTEYVVYLAQVIEISGRNYAVVSSGFDRNADDSEKYTHTGATKEECKQK